MDMARIQPRYGQRSERYCFLEAGHIAQNIMLMGMSSVSSSSSLASALNLGTVAIGSYNDDALKGLIKMSASCSPAYVVPVGHPK